jgi:glutamine synthetase
MEASDLVRDALGEPVFNWFLRNKKAEWYRYHTRVTPFELEEYLPLL